MIPGLCSIFQTLSGSFGGLSATADPAYIEAIGSGTVTTGTVTVTPLGGTAPYTYSWIYQGGDPTVVADLPTSANTTFSASGVTGSDNLYGFYSCEVIDAAAVVAYSNQVVIRIGGN